MANETIQRFTICDNQRYLDTDRRMETDDDGEWMRFVDAPDFSAEREHLHDLLQRARSVIDPETNPEIDADILAVLTPCDEAGKCVPMPQPNLSAAVQTLETLVEKWRNRTGTAEWYECADELSEALAHLRQREDTTP